MYYNGRLFCTGGVTEIHDIKNEPVTVEVDLSGGQEGEKQGAVPPVSQGEGGTLPRDNVETAVLMPIPPKDFGRAQYRS